MRGLVFYSQLYARVGILLSYGLVFYSFICEVWYFTQLYVRVGILLSLYVRFGILPQLYLRVGILLIYM